ncbi:hypothetical protein GGF43_001338, partial [Coemansia sp. RSA 2618]
MDCVSKLVGVFGEDWQRIAREIDTTPKRAERIWKMHQQRLKATSAWTDSELDTLRNCMRDGIGPAEASRLIGTKMAVSHEVQRQYEHYQRVDWAAVAKAVGRSERECLEASQFSTDKARWIYDPDTFSWETADRMTLFIEQNYPKPLPVNYTAVSNFMWIDINDCIKMASLLRGEIEWTDEVISKVVELREQGMTYKNIAKQLSPNLTIGK